MAPPPGGWATARGVTAMGGGHKKKGCLAAALLEIGGSCRIRTYDQLVKSQLLYQLS